MKIDLVVFEQKALVAGELQLGVDLVRNWRTKDPVSGS